MVNLAEDMERRAHEAPDQRGFIFEDGRMWTYQELDSWSSRASRVLRKLGLERGQRVGLYMQNSPELMFFLFGAWKLGVVPVPINVLYQSNELVGAVEKTHPRFVIADSRNLGVLRQVEAKLPGIGLVMGGEKGWTDVGQMLRLEDERPLASVDVGEEEEGVVLFSGGTTGAPKAVITTHAGWKQSLTALAAASKGRPGPYGTAPEQVPPNLGALPLFHSGGEQAMLFAFHVGRAFLLMERFRVDRLCNLVERYRVDNLFLLPTMLYDLVAEADPASLKTVKSVLVSGQELNLALRRRFEEKFRIPILQNYGSTEVGHVAGWTGQDLKEGRWKPGSAGRVYPGVRVEIRDENDKALPPGRVGEICVLTSVSKGYEGKDVTDLLVKDGWVYTRDMGYLDDEGVLFVLGRSRDMIKCGGFQVWPTEIEEVLLRHPYVREVAVIGVPDERLGEVPKAFVVLTDAAKKGADADENELVEYCRASLAHYKVPRQFSFVPTLPRSDAGKINKAALSRL